MRYLLLLLLISPVTAQDILFLDAPCMIYSNDGGPRVDWCGVALSRSVILSCGHHKKTGKVRIEFPIGNYGSETRVSFPGRVKRLDRARDLSIIEYEAPVWATVRPVTIGRINGPARIQAFLGGNTAVREALPGRADVKVDGLPVVEIMAECIPGMSGSPLVKDDIVGGVLIGSGGGVSHMVDPDTIMGFLNE